MERLTYFLLGLTYTSRIKRWATLSDLWNLVVQDFSKMRCPKMTEGWLDDCCDLPNPLLLSHGDYLSSKRFLDEKYCV